MDNNRNKTPEEILAIRKRLGLTQAQLADRVGVTPVTVARWEAGDRLCRGKYARAVGALRPEIGTLGRGISSIWNISPGHLQSLDPSRAVGIFRQLLWCLARQGGIPSTSIHVTDRVDVADGGVDACVDANVELPSTSPLVKGQSFFQVKTGGVAAPWNKSNINKELRSLIHGKTGSSLRNYLPHLSRYTYVHFGIDATESQRLRAIDNISNTLADAGFAHINVEFWGQNEIVSLANDFPSLCLGVKRETEIEFLSLDAWAAKAHMSTEIHLGQEQEGIISEIQTCLRGTEIRHIRVLGEPGIGKTRLVMESLRAEDLAPFVVYVPHAETFERSGLFNHLVRGDNSFYVILVIDECQVKNRATIWDSLKRRSDRCRLVTIDHGPDTSGDDMMRTILCPLLGEKSITQIIADYTGDKVLLSQWARLCEGSPRVAHAIGENLKHNPEDILREPSTVDIWTRFISGYGTSDVADERRRRLILEHLALFERFGYEEPVNDEADYIYSLIRRNSNDVEPSDFQRVLGDLRDRRIIQGQVTLFIVPRALQIYLWGEFWKHNGRTISIPQLLQEMPAGLQSWFMASFRYAARSQTALKKVVSLLSKNGIFADDRFLYTAKGASFLSILAEVAPREVITLLEDTLAKKSIDDLKSFSDGRQHIVWALEKIATCEPELFCRTAHLLSKLAIAENAGNSNNATGIFVGLFSLAFGGVAPTATPPDKRLPVLRELLNSSCPKKRMLGLDACKSALSHPGHVLRTVGPEFQGLRQIKLWQPITWGEYFEAYQIIWNMVLEFWRRESDELRCHAMEVLIDGAHYSLGVQHLSSDIVDTLEELASNSEAHKPLIGLISGRLRIHPDTLDSEISKRLRELDDQITGNSLQSRIRRVVLLSSWDEEYDFEEKKHGDELSCKIRFLAEEAFVDNVQLHVMLQELVTRQGFGSTEFGLVLGRKDTKHALWGSIDRVLRETQYKFVSSFVSGYLIAIYERDPAEWEALIAGMMHRGEQLDCVAQVAVASGMTSGVMEVILDALQAKSLKTEALRNLAYSRHVLLLKQEQLEKLVKLLCDDDDIIAVETAMCILDRGINNDKGEMPFRKELLRFVLLHDRCFDENTRQMFSYHWEKVAQSLIKRFPSEGRNILENVIPRLKDWRVALHLDNHQLDVLKAIIVGNPKESWAFVSGVLAQTDLSSVGGMSQWLKGRTSFSKSAIKSRVIALFPMNDVLKWIDEDPAPRAPFIARIVPKTLDKNDGGELTCVLLSRYGHMEDVRSNLYCNFETGAFSGPRSKYFRNRQTQARSWLSNTDDANVMRWLEDYIDSLQHQIERAEIEEERGY